MRISLQWLGDFLDLSQIDAARIEDILTTRVAEVDGVETCGRSLESALIAYVKSVRFLSPKQSVAESLEAKSSLKVVELSLGGNEVTVVCGAPNVQVGQYVAYLPPGATMLSPGAGVECEVFAREVSGISSLGLLPSEAELGLSASHSGIFVCEDSLGVGGIKLNRDILGRKLAELVGGADTVFVIDNKSVTHRADLWCHHGFARELSAILHRPLKCDFDAWADFNAEGRSALERLGGGVLDFDSSLVERSNDKLFPSPYRLSIEPSTGCRRFTALLIDGVATTHSPLWMRRRLHAVGAGVRNLLVDLSNYVMHDIGQPNHAYDAEALRGEILTTRMAHEGEAFLGLDGVSRSLSAEDVVIADCEKPVALGGVIGGSESSIQESTTRLLLESANFDPALIRRACKRHSLRTDASNRFEKDRSPFATPLAIHRFCELLIKEQPQARIVGPVLDAFRERPSKVAISLSTGYLRQRLAEDIDDGTARGILSSLGFQITADVLSEADSPDTSSLLVEVPYYRAMRDVTIADDLVEEVGRIFAYDNIAEVAPRIASIASRLSPISALEDELRDCLSGAGFNECYNYSFMGEADAQIFGYDVSRSIRLLNPIDREQSIIRLSLVPGMLRAAERNSRFSPEIAIFEIGRVYASELDKPGTESSSAACGRRYNRLPCVEQRLLTFLLNTCEPELESGLSMRPKVNSGALFYSAKQVLERLLARVGIPACELQAEFSKHPGFAFRAWMHPCRVAQICSGKTVLGIIAEVRPGLLPELSGRAVVCELSLDALFEISTAVERFEPLPKFPDSFFEMSVVVPATLPFSELSAIISQHLEKSLLAGLEVVAVYQGAPLPPDKKSVSVRLVLRSPEKTLGSQELEDIQSRLVRGIDSSGYSLRG